MTSPTESNRYLAVQVTVTNVSNTPASTLEDNVLVDGVVGANGKSEADHIVILGESSAAPTFQPEVTQAVVLLWEVASGSLSMGDDIKVSILDKTFTPGFLFDDSWTDPRLTAVVPVVLSDMGRKYIEDDDEPYSSDIVS